MHYTSWTRRTETGADLLRDNGPDILAHFGVAEPDGEAQVGQEVWHLHQQEEEGASISRPGGQHYQLQGNVKTAQELCADLDGVQVRLLNEQRNDWIIETVDGEKFAQFSGGNNGVRRAIMEFDPGYDDYLDIDRSIALSWFVRLILEYRLDKTSKAIIGTVLIFAIVGIIAMLLLL